MQLAGWFSCGSSATDRGRVRRNRSLDAFGWNNRLSGGWIAETAAIQIEEKPAFDEVAPSARVPVRKRYAVTVDLPEFKCGFYGLLGGKPVYTASSAEPLKRHRSNGRCTRCVDHARKHPTL